MYYIRILMSRGIDTKDSAVKAVAKNVVVLEDDRQFYPLYPCRNVVRSEVHTEPPELRDVLTPALPDASASCG